MPDQETRSSNEIKQCDQVAWLINDVKEWYWVTWLSNKTKEVNWSINEIDQKNGCWGGCSERFCSNTTKSMFLMNWLEGDDATKGPNHQKYYMHNFRNHANS